MSDPFRISISALRKRLPVGSTFTAEFIPTGEKTKRKVVGQTTHEMVSEILDGEKAGRWSYCSWTNVIANQENGVITLSDDIGPYARFYLDE